MPKAATGRGEKTTAASAVIPKITPIVRMTLAPYEALKVGHLKGLNDHQRALLAIGSYGRGRNAQGATGAPCTWRVIASQCLLSGGKADISRTFPNVCF
jgi:hypothetical protein